MNAQHIKTKKLNRYKRLVRKCKERPNDGYKRDRKQSLEMELRKEGMLA